MPRFALDLRWAVIATLCLLVCGCQRRELPLVPVEGKITFGGGEWPKPGLIYFASKTPSPNLPYKPGTAVFGTDGSFRAKTFTDGYGLVPGKYVINIECWEVPPMMGSEPSGKSYLPAKYQFGITSGFAVEVPAGTTEPVILNLDVPKQ